MVWGEASTGGSELSFSGQDVRSRQQRGENKGEQGAVCASTLDGLCVGPSYLHGALISRAIPVLINASKYESQHWAGDTCVDI